MKAFIVTAIHNGVVLSGYVCTNENLAREAYRHMLDCGNGMDVVVSEIDLDVCITWMGSGIEPGWAMGFVPGKRSKPCDENTPPSGGNSETG